MFKTLRGRFILSHALPLLVIVPLMGIVLIYVLETRVVLANLASELQGQAVLLADRVAEQPAIWSDPAQARTFLAHISPHLTAQLTLISTSRRLLASSNPAAANRLGQSLDLPDLAAVMAGGASVRTSYSRDLSADVVDVIAPVLGPDGHVMGAVRLTQQLASVAERFLLLRALIAGVLTIGLLLGALVGWRLALNLEHPLRQITRAVDMLAGGRPPVPLPERGPDELSGLAHAFNTLAERLRHLEQSRRQLLANVVHELGRPLGAMRSATQALQRGAADDLALRQELLAGMDDEIGRLQRLLNNLARLHDQFTGAPALSLRPVELNTWLERVLALRRAAAQAQGLRWEVAIPDDLPTLTVDLDRLAQALDNVLSNAIKYTPPGGVVSVDAGAACGSVWIRVSDTGPGIALEAQERIFAPFHREQLPRRFPQGMGLGLTIARNLVAAHGGRLDVRSAPGQGSHFTLWLPYGAP
jgi:two-component system, OmpR family, sensor histidine kinase BaeS